MTENKTIAAISTPLGAGGIGVIRISGPDAFEVADRVFRAKSGRAAALMRGYSCAFGEIFDHSVADSFVDTAVLTVFKKPNSYTGENIAELSCHGGVFLLSRVLRLVLAGGAALAEAGEFTKRAFLNGKLDLISAEAVAGMINSNSEAALRAAGSVLRGQTFRECEAICEKLLLMQAQISAWVDYPDDEIDDLSPETVRANLCVSIAKLERLIASYDTGRLLAEGISCAIVGKPNVGKSSLMNLLSRCERSIVTEVAGTTRDIIEESVRLGDISLRLVDTAGIRESGDVVEKIGITRALERIDECDIVLAVFDSSTALSNEDISVIERIKDKKTVAVVNKCDLESRLDSEALARYFNSPVYISALEGEGLEQLEERIKAEIGLIDFDQNQAIIINERQLGCIKAAAAALKQAADAHEQGFEYDAVGVCVDDALAQLFSLTGRSVSDEVLASVFANFCVGK